MKSYNTDPLQGPLVHQSEVLKAAEKDMAVGFHPTDTRSQRAIGQFFSQAESLDVGNWWQLFDR